MSPDPRFPPPCEILSRGASHNILNLGGHCTAVGDCRSTVDEFLALEAHEGTAR